MHQLLCLIQDEHPKQLETDVTTRLEEKKKGFFAPQQTVMLTSKIKSEKIIKILLSILNIKMWQNWNNKNQHEFSCK